VLLAIGWYYIDAYQSLNSVHYTASYSSSSPSESHSPTSAQLVAVGDVLAHRTVYEAARTDEGYDFTPMFAPVQSSIQKADVAFTNQETPVTDDSSNLSSYPRFNVPQDILGALKQTGFDVINLANNHALDQGVEGLEQTMAHVNNKNLMYIGTHASPEERKRAATKTANDITFVFRGYTAHTNGLSLPEDKSYMINYIRTADFKSDLARAREQGDVVVVSLHFGNQYQTEPSENQQKLVKKLAKQGADIILGHHPHVIQPIKRIETERPHDSVVAYSLGNFLADQIGTERNIGGIFNVEVQKSQNGIRLQNPELLPTWIAHSKDTDQFRIVPLKQAAEYGFPEAQTWHQTISDRVAPIPTR